MEERRFEWRGSGLAISGTGERRSLRLGRPFPLLAGLPPLSAALLRSLLAVLPPMLRPIQRQAPPAPLRKPIPVPPPPGATHKFPFIHYY